MLHRWFAVCVLCAACTGDTTPAREKTAAYFGLKDAFTLVYDVEQTGGTPTTASHIYRKNESFADELAFSREQRNAANFIEETVILAARDEDLRLMRVGDCLESCTDFAAPPVLMNNPVDPNTSVTSVTATTTRSFTGGMTTTTAGKEQHSVIVGAEKDVNTAAGTFRALEVAWTVSYPDEPARASVVRTFFFAPNKGIVQFSQGGKTYKLNNGITP